MATINIYLTFNGNCKEAFDFYQLVFGGEFQHIGKYVDMPANENIKIKESDKDKIMHISLPIGGSVLMGSDISNEFSGEFVQGNNFSASINADSREEADKLFKALSVEAKITMPLEDTFWGSYFGTLTDKFGINWMMSFEINQN
ncbi:MAG: VOC family protein [Flavobacteriaceae bacterium]|nr:VOC family protein [Flavobacteriaceae bacterium]